MKVLSLVFMILGCFLGAGFVSGREIASYFSRFGDFSTIAIFIAGVLFFITLYLFLRLSSKASNFSAFISIYFGKYGVIITSLFSLCVFILIGSMLAGTRSIASTLNISSMTITIFTLILCYVSVIGNEKLLSKINLYLMPIILIVILIVCGVNLNTNSITANRVFVSLVSSANYVFINIVTLGLFVLEIGNQYSNSQKLCASIISSVIIIFFMLIINNNIISNGLVYSSMPILELAKRSGNLLSTITAITIWGGLFTTIISCVFVLGNFLNKIFKNYKLTVALILISALVFSYIGFNFIVNYIYSIIGVMGMIFLIFICKKERENFVVKISRKK